RRRLEAGADAALELGAGLGDEVGGRHAIGGVVAEAVIAVVAQAHRVEEAAVDARLQLHEAGIVGGLRRDRAVADLVELMLGAEGHDLALGDAEIALPIELDAVATVETGLSAGRQVAPAVVGVAEAERLIEATVEGQDMRRRTREELARLAVALRGIRKGADILVAGEAQIGVDVARDEADIEIVEELHAQLGPDALIVVSVVVAQLARRQQVERRHRRAVGVEMAEVESVADAAGRAAGRTRLIESAVGAALDARFEMRRSAAGLGDDVDDAADGVGAVEPALRSAQHLDALDAEERQMREIEAAIG